MGTDVEAVTVYGRAEFQDVDVGAIMRDGHPDIAEGDELIVSLVGDHARRKGRPLRIMDVGSGSGVLSELIARRLPGHQVIANDVEPALIALAEGRLLGYPDTEVFGRQFGVGHLRCGRFCAHQCRGGVRLRTRSPSACLGAGS